MTHKATSVVPRTGLGMCWGAAGGGKLQGVTKGGHLISVQAPRRPLGCGRSGYLEPGPCCP